MLMLLFSIQQASDIAVARWKKYQIITKYYLSAIFQGIVLCHGHQTFARQDTLTQGVMSIPCRCRCVLWTIFLWGLFVQFGVWHHLVTIWFCCMENSLSFTFHERTQHNRFGMTWWWVNNDKCVTFGWTTP